MKNNRARRASAAISYTDYAPPPFRVAKRVKIIFNGTMPFYVELSTTRMGSPGLARVLVASNYVDGDDDADPPETYDAVNRNLPKWTKVWKTIKFKQAWVGYAPWELNDKASAKDGPEGGDTSQQSAPPPKTTSLFRRIFRRRRIRPSPRPSNSYYLTWWHGGNSVLLQLDDGSNEYVMIGPEIYSFKTVGNEPLVSFASPVTGSDNAYPYAVGSRYTYLLAHRDDATRASNTTVRDVRALYDNGKDRRHGDHYDHPHFFLCAIDDSGRYKRSYGNNELWERRTTRVRTKLLHPCIS